MTSDTEKLLLFGLLGLIAWELWPKQQAQAGGSGLMGNDPLSNTPPWIQQLSAVEQIDCQLDAGQDALDCLLSIPQGPGGTGGNITENFFSPTRGILGQCNQTPGNIVRPTTWSIA